MVNSGLLKQEIRGQEITNLLFLLQNKKAEKNISYSSSKFSTITKKLNKIIQTLCSKQ